MTLHQVPERRHLRFDAGGELELNQGPLQVVIGVVGLEVGAAQQVIAEEAQPQLKTDQLGRIGDVAQLGLGEKTAGHSEIPLQQSVREVEIKVHCLDLIGFFSEWIATGAQTVADVVMHQTGLHGVQVDQGNGLTAAAIEQHVVDLGIAVNGP